MTFEIPDLNFDDIPEDYEGFNVLLEGPTGTGKTYAIASLAKVGLEVFYIGLEPGLETLMGAFTDPAPRGWGLDALPDNFHWHVIQSTKQDFKDMRKTAGDIGKFDLSALTKMRDPNRGANNPMLAVYDCLNDFKDMKDGKSYGSPQDWGHRRVIVIDGLSALSRMALEMLTGSKPVRDKPDYGIAQQNLFSLIQKLCSGCKCHFVILAHVQREVDEVLGGIKLLPVTVGKAITAEILQPFSDVILATREVNKWYWDTANTQADLKARNLPISSKIEPDFGLIFNSWFRRAKISGKSAPK